MKLPQRLIQITDFHLCEEPGEILCSEIITDHSLHLVLDQILVREGRGATVLVTGDLAQDPASRTYQRLREILQAYPFRFLCVPGNHDDVTLMRRFLEAPNVTIGGTERLGDWSLVLLDSTAEGAPYGRLGPRETVRLRQELETVSEGHALLALHHHPVAVRSPWMDRMALTDSASLFDAVDRSGRVRAVLFGHIHQEVDTLRAGIHYLGTPSTCVQFAPNSLTMSLDGGAPAYRWLDLHHDGKVETSVVYLGQTRLSASA